MTAGSLQQQRYLSARRQGRTMTTAAVEAGIGIGEARLLEADIARDPSLLDPPEPEPAPAAPAQPQENEMGRPKKAETGHVTGEVLKPDFALAVKLYRHDIKPAQAKVGEFAQEQSTAYKAIKKTAHVEPNAARQAFRLDQMEEAKRDDWLRSFNGLLKELNIFMPRDLADIAEGKGTTGENVVPFGDRAAPQLATIPQSDGIDADLAGDDLPDLPEEGHDPDADTPDKDHEQPQAAE
jgi:hypothetical protein